MSDVKFSLACLVLSLCLVNLAGAGDVVMQCDVGGCGPLQAGWTALAGCGTHTNVAGPGIDVSLVTGNPGACTCRNLSGSGDLADVETDFCFADNKNYSPASDFILTLSNLTPGTAYKLLSYHSRTDEGDTTIPNVTITGATNVTVPDSIVQTHAIMETPAECLFTAGSGDVGIRYQGPDGGCPGCQVFFNGFVLELSAPSIAFASDASGGVETISPALIPVNLFNPEPGETYTVQYAVTGGTATGGDDYTLTPGTLIFSPGQTTKNISINIVNDGVPEEDETIIVSLSNPTGLDVVLRLNEHTYTISDFPPTVAFDSAGSSGAEDVTPATIAVSLSHAGDETVTVDYAVSGGTAANGDDYILADGTLQFEPLDTTEYIAIGVIDDSLEEEDETIVLSLSDPCNATPGTTLHHTYSILDNEQGVVWDGLVWYYSHNPDNLFVNTDGALEWKPEEGGQYVTRIPDKPFSQTGDKVEVSYWYMSDGKHDCPPDTCYNCIYCDDDITCIAGTADFRFGLFQADGEYVTADGFSIQSSIFEGYKGYNWRFGPHLLPYPTRWVDCTGEVHKTGNFNKKPQSSDNLMMMNEGEIRDEEWNIQYIPGFDLPPGEWSLLTISLERLNSSDVELSITLNDTTYTCIDMYSSEQPSMIDVFGIHMRNGRPYSRLVLGSLAPEPAWDPSPMDGTKEADPNLGLSWRPGNSASWHDVYFGTDFSEVTNADTSSSVYKGRQSVDANSYDPPGPLEPEPTYYWRVDEVNPGYPDSKGNVWSFTVCSSCVVVEDMESYNNTNNRIWDTWIDGWENATGSVLALGIDPCDPVHGGKQSMMFFYNNDSLSALYKYSEVYRTFSDPRDWTVLGVKVLTLYFYGDPGNDANQTEQMYVGLEDSTGADSYAELRYGDNDEDMNDIKEDQWHEWNIALMDFTGVDANDVNKVYIGFGDRDHPAAGGLGTVYFDDLRLYAHRCILPGPYADINADCVVDHKDLKIMAEQWLDNGSLTADLCEDDMVNFKDFTVLAGDWLDENLWP